MIDAYDLQKELLDAWRPLASNNSGESVQKKWPVIPVYVEVDGKLQVVDTLITEDNKIILKIK